MDCQKTNLMLADYSVSNLNASQTRLVEEHLQGCSACRKRLAELRAVGDLLEGLESLEPPAEIWQEIRARGERLFAAPARREVPSVRGLRWAFVSAVMAILIFAFSVFLSLRFFQPRPPEIVPALPMDVVYQGQPAVQGKMADYFHEHAATSTQDSLSDPASLGLVSFSVGEPLSEGER
jgi:hypothetical protein